MNPTNTRTPLLSQNTQRTLVLLLTCFLGHVIESWLKIDYTWGLSIGLALSYPYHSTDQLGQYLLKIGALAGIFGAELSAVNRTGITSWLIREYRARYVDTQVVTAFCIVLLLTPIIDVIVKYLLEPVLVRRIPSMGIKIIATMIFGAAIAILNQFGAISFVVKQCRDLNLDAHLITAMCVMFVLAPINDLVGNFIKDLFHS